MKEGERVRITTKNGLILEGMVLPGEKLALKLDDGYNIGVEQRNVASTETLDQTPTQKAEAQLVQKDGGLPKIALLHTGGTIASKVDYETGGVSSLFEPEEILSLYPELQKVGHVEAEFVANMWSDDMRFAHYNILAQAVADAIAKHDPKGIIITMGTDTLHFSAIALHYALRNVPVPVVLVGSQRSSDRGSSDAPTNLLGVTRFMTQVHHPGVYVGMHASSSDNAIAIMRAVNCRKMHTARRDAFKSINTPVIAHVDGEDIVLVTEPPKQSGKFEVKKYNENLKIGMCLLHPQFFPEQLEVYKDFNGLVLLGTGLGHAPINEIDGHTKLHKEHFAKISTLAQKMPVVMCSQCVNGRVSLQVYSPARKLQEEGVLGHDSALTPETTFIKLAHLLSHNLDPKTELLADYGDSVERTEQQTYE